MPDVRPALSRLMSRCSRKSEGDSTAEECIVHIACLFFYIVIHGVMAESFSKRAVMQIPKDEMLTSESAQTVRDDACSFKLDKTL